MRDSYKSEKESRSLWKKKICSRNSHKYILNTGKKTRGKEKTEETCKNHGKWKANMLAKNFR